MTGSHSPTRSRKPSPNGTPNLRSLQESVDDLYEFLQSHAFPLKKLQQDFAELKLKVESPSEESKTTKLDERNIKLDHFTGIYSLEEEYLEWERQVDKLANVKGLNDSQTFKLLISD